MVVRGLLGCLRSATWHRSRNAESEEAVSFESIIVTSRVEYRIALLSYHNCFGFWQDIKKPILERIYFKRRAPFVPSVVWVRKAFVRIRGWGAAYHTSLPLIHTTVVLPHSLYTVESVVLLYGCFTCTG